MSEKVVLIENIIDRSSNVGIRDWKDGYYGRINSWCHKEAGVDTIYDSYNILVGTDVSDAEYDFVLVNAVADITDCSYRFGAGTGSAVRSTSINNTRETVINLSSTSHNGTDGSNSEPVIYLQQLGKMA